MVLLLRPFVVAVIVPLLLEVSPAFADGIDLRLRIARDTIIQNDCQLALVCLENKSDAPIAIDYTFRQLICGPVMELKPPGGEFGQVYGVFQAAEVAAEEDTGEVIPARTIIAELFLFRPTRSNTHRRTLFHEPGAYSLRAKVRVKGKWAYSEAEAFTVSGDVQIPANDLAAKRVIGGVPLPGSVDAQEQVVESLPKESLLHELGRLELDASQFIAAPGERREVWQKKRQSAPPLLADWVTLGTARHFFGSREYKLAAEEYSRMKVETIEARFYKEEAKRLRE